MNDHYQVLGVIPDAEAVVIKAAYRALISIYHPDKNPDPTAEEKTKAINEAYSVLSDPIKKSEYDKGRAAGAHNANSTAFDQKRPFEKDTLEKGWSIASGFYPNIQAEYEYLGKISWRLSFAFKLLLSESQEYKNSNQIANKIKKEYLIRYFGKNEEIVNYAEQLVIYGETQAALHLNEIVNVMGKSVDSWQVKDIVDEKFPGINKRIRGKFLYNYIAHISVYAYASCGEVLDEISALNDGVVERSFWNSKINFKINNEDISFSSNEDFRRYMLSKFSEIYA